MKSILWLLALCAALLPGLGHAHCTKGCRRRHLQPCAAGGGSASSLVVWFTNEQKAAFSGVFSAAGSTPAPFDLPLSSYDLGWKPARSAPATACVIIASWTVDGVRRTSLCCGRPIPKADGAVCRCRHRRRQAIHHAAGADAPQGPGRVKVDQIDHQRRAPLKGRRTYIIGTLQAVTPVLQFLVGDLDPDRPGQRLAGHPECCRGSPCARSARSS